MTTTIRKKVNPLTEPNDFKCALAGEFGFSTKHIESQTGLTTSQISYRLRKFGITRANYRNGDSIGARAVLQQARQMVGYQLENNLRTKLGI